MSLTTPTVSGWSGFWQMQGDKNAYAMLPGQARSVMDRLLAQRLKRNQYRDVAAALNALIGAASGSNMTKTYKRVQAASGPSQAVPTPSNFGDFGGNETIETVTVVNRNTTAADVTFLKAYINDKLLEAGITYPTPLGFSVGNGLAVGGVVRF